MCAAHAVDRLVAWQIALRAENTSHRPGHHRGAPGVPRRKRAAPRAALPALWLGNCGQAVRPGRTQSLAATQSPTRRRPRLPPPPTAAHRRPPLARRGRLRVRSHGHRGMDSYRHARPLHPSPCLRTSAAVEARRLNLGSYESLLRRSESVPICRVRRFTRYRRGREGAKASCRTLVGVPADPRVPGPTTGRGRRDTFVRGRPFIWGPPRNGFVLRDARGAS